MSSADLHFYFDPVCPFAWMTSKWVRLVADRRDYAVDWRFVSLRQLNAHIDYATHFPPDYEAGHEDGLRLLRMAARVRAEHGRPAVAALYESLGSAIFEVPGGPGTGERSAREFVTPILTRLQLPTAVAAALDDEEWDLEIAAETDEALSLTGKDVGTPILHFQPPQGTAFFGPVISRLPDADAAVELWDHVVALAEFPGFAELKRSMRERPQLVGFGVPVGETGQQEDWHAGSRRKKR